MPVSLGLREFETSPFAYTAPVAYSSPEKRQPIDTVRFSDFDSPGQAEWVRARVADLGFSPDRLREVKYRPTPNNRPDLLGMAELESGVVTLYKSIEGLPQIAQLGVISHEYAHVINPFSRENASAYKTQAGMERAANHTVAIAKQSLATGVYLDGYHRHLASQLARGEINAERFYHETFAIMAQLRLTNSAHLRQVEDAQLAKGGTRCILTPIGINAPVGIDAALCEMVAGVKDANELRYHIASVRAKYERPDHRSLRHSVTES